MNTKNTSRNSHTHNTIEGTIALTVGQPVQLNTHNMESARRFLELTSRRNSFKERSCATPTHIIKGKDLYYSKRNTHKRSWS